MNPRKFLYRVFGIELALVILVCLLLDSSQKTEAFLLGSFIGSLNFVLLWWIWHLTLFKKRVARVLPIVVFKYSILIILLAFFGSKINNVLFFVTGIVSLPLAIATYAILYGLRAFKD